MRKYLLLIAIFILLFSNSMFGNGSNGNGLKNSNLPDSLKFQSYLDSIEKYVYLDSRQILPYKLKCEQLIDNGKALSNTNLLGFAIQNIYYHYTQDSILEVTKTIADNQNLLTYKDIPAKLIKDFQYLDAFTSKTLGDYESAQKLLYSLLNQATEEKDQSTKYKVLYVLADIYKKQNDIEKAESYFIQSYDLAKIVGKTQSSKIHVLIDLVDLYIEEADFEQARYYNSIGLHQSDSLNMLDFQIDFLTKEIVILVNENKLVSAEKTYQTLLTKAKLMENEYYLRVCQEVYPKILIAKKNYSGALAKYQELIEKVEQNEQGSLIDLLGYYESAHDVALQNNTPKIAYDYLLKYNKVKDSLSLEEQFQKTEYWKIKFDADQKEKENAILVAEVQQEKTQNQLLFALASICLLGVLFLFRMIRQKRKYTTQLQKDVKDRTIELEKANVLLSESNEELNQLTNMLSHDLKEPIRSIVGFSSLASKEVFGNAKLEEYLNYVNRGGEQLNQLIDDVTVFQNIGTEGFAKKNKVDLNGVVDGIKDRLSNLIREKKAIIDAEGLPVIFADTTSIFLVFKILIENGLKYNESKTAIINIRYKAKEKQHCFLFQDNGIGIAPEFKEHIFGMFKRLNNRNDYSGSGLGLSIVKKILVKINGDIKLISSNAEDGSVFQICLPMQDESPDKTILDRTSMF